MFAFLFKPYFSRRAVAVYVDVGDTTCISPTHYIIILHAPDPLCLNRTPQTLYTALCLSILTDVPSRSTLPQSLDVAVRPIQKQVVLPEVVHPERLLRDRQGVHPHGAEGVALCMGVMLVGTRPVATNRPRNNPPKFPISHLHVDLVARGRGLVALRDVVEHGGVKLVDRLGLREGRTCQQRP